MNIVNIVNMITITYMTIAVLDEPLLWIRCRQLCREAREAVERLNEVHEAPTIEHLYSNVL